MSDESSSDEDFEDFPCEDFFCAFNLSACILACRIVSSFPAIEHAPPFMVDFSGELEELDDSEDFEEMDGTEELVFIETCSGCCFPSTSCVDGFVAVNRECGWCRQHLGMEVTRCPLFISKDL